MAEVGLMYVCRLFHRDRPAQELGVRLLGHGRLSVGRDPAADWAIDDPQGILSRIHFLLSVEEGALLLTDCSTNGTFLGDGARAPRDVPVPLAASETVRFGSLALRIEQPARERSQPLLPVADGTVPGAWLDGSPPPPRHPDESLIEAFCEGAGLDSSALSGEDPAELMRRLGAIYQQSVLGLATLMHERARFKGDHRLDRTTIAAADNNPFKWAPTRRLATALLSSQGTGFLSGAEAVRASFDDVVRHLVGVAAGGNAALDLVLDRLSPQGIEEEAGGQGFSLLRGGGPYREAHARRHAGISGTDRVLVERAFAEAYLQAETATTP